MMSCVRAPGWPSISSGFSCLVGLCFAGLRALSWRAPSWSSVQTTCLSYVELDQRTCSTKVPRVPTVLRGLLNPMLNCFREYSISQESKGLSCLVLIWVSGSWSEGS